MIPKHCTRVMGLLALLAVPFSALAQERGRTDGPEGSEYGKGGYRRQSGYGNFSLELNFGGAVGETNPLGGSAGRVPLYAGATASWWGDDWFLLELQGGYNFFQQRANIELGPRFRTAYFPVSLYAGVKAGPVITAGEGIRFAISPTGGADIMIGDHVLMGLGYTYDIVFGSFGSHRILMNVGWRF